MQAGGAFAVAGAHPARLLFGHYSRQLLALSVVGVVVLNFRPARPGPAYLLASLGLAALVIAAFLALRAHDRRLCELCVTRMPLDPAARAATMTDRFWLAHAASNPFYVVGYLAVMAGSNFLPTIAGRLAWAILTLSMIYPLLAYDTHRRFQPWCPWCSDGGGGGGNDVDAPEPILPSLSSR